MNIPDIGRSVMSMFQTAPTAPQAQQPAQQTNGQPVQQAPQSLTQQATPDINNEVAKVDPMDTFKDIWAPTPKVEGAEDDFDPSNIFNINPETMQAAVGKINFAEVITKEDMAEIMGGGEGAMQAFARAINASSAKTMAMSTTAAAKMVETAMTRANGAMDKRIAGQVKLNQVSSQMQELNPALSHPAAAPMVNALKAQFTNKHPTATPSEITTMISSYLDNFAGIAAGKKEEQAPAGAATAATDWSKYFGA